MEPAEMGGLTGLLQLAHRIGGAARGSKEIGLRQKGGVREQVGLMAPPNIESSGQ